MSWCVWCGGDKVIAKSRLKNNPLCATCIVKDVTKKKMKENVYLRLFIVISIFSVVFYFVIKHFELYKY